MTRRHGPPSEIACSPCQRATASALRRLTCNRPRTPHTRFHPPPLSAHRCPPRLNLTTLLSRPQMLARNQSTAPQSPYSLPQNAIEFAHQKAGPAVWEHDPLKSLVVEPVGTVPVPVLSCPRAHVGARVLPQCPTSKSQSQRREETAVVCDWAGLQFVRVVLGCVCASVCVCVCSRCLDRRHGAVTSSNKHIII